MYRLHLEVYLKYECRLSLRHSISYVSRNYNYKLARFSVNTLTKVDKMFIVRNSFRANFVFPPWQTAIREDSHAIGQDRLIKRKINYSSIIALRKAFFSARDIRCDNIKSRGYAPLALRKTAVYMYTFFRNNLRVIEGIWNLLCCIQ